MQFGLQCITNELKGANSKLLKSLQSQKNDDPKKTLKLENITEEICEKEAEKIALRLKIEEAGENL